MWIARRADGSELARGDSLEKAINVALSELTLTSSVRYVTKETADGVVVSGRTDAGDFQFIVTEEQS